jgi:hypothetical protein
MNFMIEIMNKLVVSKMIFSFCINFPDFSSNHHRHEEKIHVSKISFLYLLKHQLFVAGSKCASIT